MSFMNLTVRDVSKLLNVSEKTIYRMIQRQEIPAYRIQDQFRFNRAELLDWAMARKISVSPEIVAEPESQAEPTPRLVEALKAGGIFYRLPGTDREGALRSVVNVMKLPEDMDPEFLLSVLLAREELASTGIGDGIAIPHVRNPIVLQVGRPLITLSFLEQPVDFGALDGRPVFGLFTMITPNARAHLNMLSRLSFALRKEPFMRAVQTQAPRETILAELERVEAEMDHVAGAVPHLGAGL